MEPADFRDGDYAPSLIIGRGTGVSFGRSRRQYRLRSAANGGLTSLTTPPTLLISHTTRDKRDHDLAHRLAAGLQERGARVWIAPDSLPVGREWKEGLVAGIMENCSHFLVILSAASIQSKWVLDEIQLARRRYEKEPEFSVMSLATGTLEKFRNDEFLNKFQSVPYHTDFHAQLEAVAQAAELRPSVPDNVRALIAEKTRDFVGREYVFDAIGAFMKENPNGYFIIEGDPGAGKSAILATFVQLSGCVAHFNVRSQGINTAAQFLASACAQLISRFGLKYASLPPEAAQNGQFLSKLLAEAAEQLGKKESLVVAVDALDEVDMSAQQGKGNILFLPSELPKNVYFVLTRRQTPLPFTVGAPQTLFDLMAHRDLGKRDIQEFIRQQTARRAKLREWLAEQSLEVEAFVTQLSDLSQDNFMYVRHVLPEIERGVYAGLKVSHLPAGLMSYYEDHWRRMGMTAKPLPRTKIQIVYVLAEAHRPVSRRLIARIANSAAVPVDELAVQEVLDEWDEFLREERADDLTQYSIYHASFQDFLHRQDIVQAAGVTLKGIGSLIADNMWDDLLGPAPANP
jgi:hypothetical protein